MIKFIRVIFYSIRFFFFFNIIHCCCCYSISYAVLSLITVFAHRLTVHRTIIIRIRQRGLFFVCFFFFFISFIFVWCETVQKWLRVPEPKIQKKRWKTATTTTPTTKQQIISSLNYCLFALLYELCKIK